MPRPKNGIRVFWLNQCVIGSSGDLASAAMTTAYVSSPPRGRRVKFTPEVIESIRKLVAQGIDRHEIANRLCVTVGSLQVTCSRLGISLRRISVSNGSHHTLEVRGSTIPAPCSLGVAHVREQREVPQPGTRAAPVVQFAITMRCHGKEKTSDVPLPSPAIAALALEATSRNLNMVDLMGQVLIAAISKDMIHNILR
jgi:hypothetical protein